MRKFIFFLLCFSLCVLPVFADDELSDDSQSVQTIDDILQDNQPSQVVVDITQLLTPTVNDPEVDENKVQAVEVVEPILVNAETTQLRISPSDTSGFKAVLLSLLGDYETTVTDYTYQSGSSGYYSHSINIERDWTWICSCAIFGLLIWSTFRTIGGICSRW